MTSFVKLAIAENIATVTLNRPDKRNAMNGQFITELAQVLQIAAHATDSRVLILCGSGEHFCAGADLAWMQEMATKSKDENYQDAKCLADLLHQLATFPKPTIALAHGAALGGGLGLLSACDIALAEEGANFRFSEVKIGITPSTISPYVIAAMGERAARYYFLTGERFSATEAYRIGLVHKIVQKDILFDTGFGLAKGLLLNSPHAMHEVKQLIRMVSHEIITADLIQKTAEHLATLRTSSEAKEGLRAFLEKREPMWEKSS